MECNIDNSSYITLWEIANANNKYKKTKNPQWEKEMKQIRRTHVCHKCKKYPGDRNYTFGVRKEGRYLCFECS